MVRIGQNGYNFNLIILIPDSELLIPPSLQEVYRKILVLKFLPTSFL